MVGCGGSGTKAVRYVRSAVERSLLHAGWDGEFPSAWQFLGVDTLTTQEEPAEIPLLPPESYVSLSMRHASYAPMHQSLLVRHPPADPSSAYRRLLGWVPSPQKVTIPLADGAGQNRAVGRVAALSSLAGPVGDALRKALAATRTGRGQLRQVSEALGDRGSDGEEMPEPLVAVVSSMAGGTGAGIALDVVDMLRSADVQGAFPALILFTPDIFDLPASSSAMSANALGLVAETLAAYWSDADGGNGLLPKARQSPGVGPHSVFMIGRYGLSGADLGDTSSVYRAAGEALSKWVTSEAVQARVHNFIAVNWANSSKQNYGGYPFGQRHQRGVVSSFGAAVLSLGRDRFADWAQDLLACETLHSLLTGHLSSAAPVEDAPAASDDDPEFAVPEEDDGADEAALAAAAKAVHGIITGESRADAHRRPLYDLHELLDHGHAKVRADVQRRVSDALAGSHSGTGRQWAQWISQQVSRAERDVPAFDAGAWGASAAADVCAGVSRVVAQTSLLAAAAAVSMAQESLRARAEDYRMEVPTHASAAEAASEEARTSLSKASGSLKASDPKVQACIAAEAAACVRRWRADRLSTAADCLHDVCSQVLEPVRESLTAAARSVASAMRSDGVRLLPRRGRGVPDRYAPTAVEFVLEGPQAWPQMLDRMCAEAPLRSYAGPRPIDRVRAAVVEGLDPSAADASDSGAPLVRLSASGWEPGRRAQVVCDLAGDPPAAVSERVRAWMRRPGSSSDRMLSEGLASWLSGTDPATGQTTEDMPDRLVRYRKGLSDALGCAQPLLRVDSVLYGQTHPASFPEVQVLCEPFPFGPGHPAAAPTVSAVGEAAFSSTPMDSSSVLVSAYVPVPIHPIAVRSFTAPVAEAVQACSASSDRLQSSWWMWRRSRTLPEFVPLPPPMLRAMVRGFAVGRMLGCVSTVDGVSPVRIASEDGSVHEFPFPLLTRAEPDDTLAALLEGFVLVYAHAVSDGLSAFDAYKELYLLGDDGHSLHPELVAWIRSGRLDRTIPGVLPPLGEASSAAARRKKALSYLDRNIGHLRGLMPPERAYTGGESRSDDGSADPGVPSMEMAAEVVLPCYERLRGDIEGYTESSGVV